MAVPALPLLSATQLVTPSWAARAINTAAPRSLKDRVGAKYSPLMQHMGRIIAQRDERGDRLPPCTPGGSRHAPKAALGHDATKNVLCWQPMLQNPGVGPENPRKDSRRSCTSSGQPPQDTAGRSAGTHIASPYDPEPPRPLFSPLYRQDASLRKGRGCDTMKKKGGEDDAAVCDRPGPGHHQFALYFI